MNTSTNWIEDFQISNIQCSQMWIFISDFIWIYKNLQMFDIAMSPVRKFIHRFSHSTHINSIISMLVVGSQFGILSIRLNSSRIFLKGNINPNDNNLLFILFFHSFSHWFCKSRMNSNLYAILLLSGPFLIFIAGIERGRISFSQCNHFRICILELELRFHYSRILIRISSGV